MSEGAAEPWRRVGANVFVRLEPPDLFTTRAEGPLSGPDLTAVLAELKRLAAERGHLFWLADVSGLGVVSPEARKVASVEALRLPIRGLSAFGVSFHHRVVTTLVITAMRSLHPSGHRVLLPALHDTEAEARAWIEERRGERARAPR